MPSVIVTCEGLERTVFIDNQSQGLTDTVLSVPIGRHVFDLGLPANYLPPFHDVFIDTVPDPTIVPFTPLAAFVGRARERLMRARGRERAAAGRASPALDGPGRETTTAAKSRKKRTTKKTSKTRKRAARGKSSTRKR